MGFVSFFKGLGSHLLKALPEVLKAIPDIFQGGISGASAGASLGPEGAIGGGLAGGIMGGLSHLSPIIESLTGAGQSIPMQPQDLVNALNHGKSAVQDAWAMRDKLPPDVRAKLEGAVNSASQNKYVSGAVNTGSFIHGMANKILNTTQQGGVRSDALEKLGQPLVATSNALLSPGQAGQLNLQRTLTHASQVVVPSPSAGGGGVSG